MLTRLSGVGDDLRYWWERRWAEIWTAHFSRIVFVHINKTAGTSIEKALGLPFQHRTAPEFRDLMGERRFDRAFRFTFVRNPYEKVVSHFHYRVKTNQTGLGQNPIPFSEWVKRAYGGREKKYFDQPRMFAPQLDWLRDPGGPLLVEFVGRFENLAADYLVVAKKLGRSSELPHLKTSKTRNSLPDLYDEEALEVVRSVFSEDLEYFGYSFEDLLQ